MEYTSIMCSRKAGDGCRGNEVSTVYAAPSPHWTSISLVMWVIQIALQIVLLNPRLPPQKLLIGHSSGLTLECHLALAPLLSAHCQHPLSKELRPLETCG